MSVNEARRIGIEWENGHRQMIVVGDGSFIPTYFHELELQIADHKIIAPIGFSERLGVRFNILGRTGILN